MPLVMGQDNAAIMEQLLPTLDEFVHHVLVFMLLSGFGVCTVHRLYHENQWMWINWHKVHHQTEVSTASAAFYKHDFELFYNVASFLFAIAVTKPHPVTFCFLYTFALVNLAVTHSCLDVWWLDVMTLRFAPFRLAVAHHDAHHQFSSRSKNPKNFGLYFTVWDQLLGTFADY